MDLKEKESITMIGDNYIADIMGGLIECLM